MTVLKQVFNPYLPLNEYIPDGEPHVFGDRVYIFGSHDRAGGETFCELDYVVYSADIHDLTDWRCEGTIYSAGQDPHHTETVKGAGERKYLYAPDVAQGPDGRYYLYYCLSAFAGKGGFDGPVSVAVCDTPAGKYEYYGDVHYADGRTMLDFIPFDPGVINDDGHIYLYYGWALPVKPAKSRMVDKIYRKIMHGMFPKKTMEEIYSSAPGIMGANMVELEDDMLTVKQPPKRIIPCEMDAKGTSFEGHAFFEGSSIRKVNGMYYLIYSSSVNHELCYAVSQYPDRGFEYGGVIISNGDIGVNGRKSKDRVAATGNNHGSIEQINGIWYIFYHRHTHLTSNSRQGCAEKIRIEKDGSIRQVCMTSCGLNRGPLAARGTYPASIACNLTDGRMPHVGNGKCRKKKPCIVEENGKQYITGIHNHTLIGYKYFDLQDETFITLMTRGTGKGIFRVCADPSKTLARIEVTPSGEWKESSEKLRIEGTHTIYLIYEGSGMTELLSIDFSVPSVRK